MTKPTNEELKDLLGKVTQGQWHIDEEGWIVGNDGTDPVCMIESGGITDVFEQAKHDATLIALAPTLADEVVRLRVVADAFEELLGTVEGECPSLVDEDSGASHVLLNLLWDARQALDATSAK